MNKLIYFYNNKIKYQKKLSQIDNKKIKYQNNIMNKKIYSCNIKLKKNF